MKLHTDTTDGVLQVKPLPGQGPFRLSTVVYAITDPREIAVPYQQKDCMPGPKAEL